MNSGIWRQCMTYEFSQASHTGSFTQTFFTVVGVDADVVSAGDGVASAFFVGNGGGGGGSRQ